MCVRKNTYCACYEQFFISFFACNYSQRYMLNWTYVNENYKQHDKNEEKKIRSQRAILQRCYCFTWHNLKPLKHNCHPLLFYLKFTVMCTGVESRWYWWGVQREKYKIMLCITACHLLCVNVCFFCKIPTTKWDFTGIYYIQIMWIEQILFLK